MATCIDIADALVTEINGGSFSQPFTAARELLPNYELAEMTDLHVTVVPKAVEITPFSRAMHQHEVQIDIGIQKKIASDIESEVPQLMTLVEEIADYLRKRPLAGMPQVVWFKAACEPIFSHQHLAEKRLFTGILTVTYRVVR